MSSVHEFCTWLDEQPRTPTGVLARTPGAETRNVAIEVVAREFRTHRRRPLWEQRVERRKHQLAILAHMIEKEEPQ